MIWLALAAFVAGFASGAIIAFALVRSFVKRHLMPVLQQTHERMEQHAKRMQETRRRIESGARTAGKQFEL